MRREPPSTDTCKSPSRTSRRRSCGGKY
jgi:hypothetical protein